MDVRGRLHALASRFTGSTEIFVYKTVYYILKLAVSRSSQKVCFITNRPERRTWMLKPRAALRNLDANNTDIYMSNDLLYYAARDERLEDYTL